MALLQLRGASPWKPFSKGVGTRYRSSSTQRTSSAQSAQQARRPCRIRRRRAGSTARSSSLLINDVIITISQKQKRSHQSSKLSCCLLPCNIKRLVLQNPEPTESSRKADHTVLVSYKYNTIMYDIFQNVLDAKPVMATEEKTRLCKGQRTTIRL